MKVFAIIVGILQVIMAIVFALFLLLGISEDKKDGKLKEEGNLLAYISMALVALLFLLSAVCLFVCAR